MRDYTLALQSSLSSVVVPDSSEVTRIIPSEDMDLKPLVWAGGTIENTASGCKLGIPAGAASGYRLAQLDDYSGLRRSHFAWYPPLSLALEARVSNTSPTGTWGFGFWNDPYGFSLGTGSQFLRLPALPRTVWFFGASPHNYLSFRDDLPANGFRAQVFDSPRFSPALIPAALALPLAPGTTRCLISRIISEDASRVNADPRDWRKYSIDWSLDRTSFRVDDTLILESAVSPRGPLGLVIWIDNQYAAFERGSRPRWGVEAAAEKAWLEVAEIHIEGGEFEQGLQDRYKGGQ